MAESDANYITESSVLSLNSLYLCVTNLTLEGGPGQLSLGLFCGCYLSSMRKAAFD